MMMTEIQHPTDSGDNSSFADNVRSSHGFASEFESLQTKSQDSEVELQLPKLESPRPSRVDSQDLTSSEYMQNFFAEALARSSQRIMNSTGDWQKARLVEESEPRPSDVVSTPSCDEQRVNASTGATSGLDLLGSLALTKPPAEPSLSPTTNMAPPPSDTTVREWVEQETAAKMRKEERIYVDKILEWDVLCGRGGKSNHWSGNKRYRQVVAEMKAMYRSQDDKSAKTDLSRAIVDYVCNYGGRFLKKEGYTDRYYVLTRAEARKKTSQALRETKEPKWTL